jgi:hypothetical protein
MRLARASISSMPSLLVAALGYDTRNDPCAVSPRSAQIPVRLAAFAPNPAITHTSLGFSHARHRENPIPHNPVFAYTQDIANARTLGKTNLRSLQNRAIKSFCRSDSHTAYSSSGQDTGISSRRQRFNSFIGYHAPSNARAKPTSVHGYDLDCRRHARGARAFNPASQPMLRDRIIVPTRSAMQHPFCPHILFCTLVPTLKEVVGSIVRLPGSRRRSNRS